MNTIVSIIVPVYNAEPYLRRCVDSIIAQSFHNWELILVDDGSTDGSGAICDEYASGNDRMTVIHKVNGGVSSARNAGLKIAKGAWVTFIDSDDTIGENYFNVELSPDVDLYIACSKEDWIPRVYEKNELNQFLAQNMCDLYFRVPWGKFFNKSTMGRLSFDESMRLGEDTVFNLRFIRECKKMAIVENIVYNYQESDISTRYVMTVDEGVDIVKSIFMAYKPLNINSKSFDIYIPRLISRVCCRKTSDLYKFFSNDYVRKMYFNSISFSNLNPLVKYIKNISYLFLKQFA